ncbi:aldehyde dehydrogenase family protein [Streptomyces sp. NPDC005820]|uniref:aldehyde dehydrogenase family protein n=1 Tax=Streptomyces sp. NPDC005820 TaxID=3157069 RepID=UPI0033CD37E0
MATIADLTPYVGGRPYTQGEAASVVEPATGQLIGRVPDVGAEGAAAAVQAAKEAAPKWAATLPKDRAAALLAIADAMEARIDEFAELEARDVGKPLAAARGEIASAADKYRFFAGAARTLTTAASAEYKPGITSIVRREPLGVVAAIAPWNYPMGLTSWKIGPALAGGNTVVLKPALDTSLTALLLAEIANDILPPGVLNVVTGSGPGVGAALATHPDVAMVSLTGGTDTGRRLMALAAPTVKKMHLELGGKAPVLVYDDADLDAFAAVVRGAVFRNSGQDCTAATRVYTSPKLRDEVVDILTTAAKDINVGNGFVDESVEMGPVVSERHRKNVVGFVERALASGARAAAGGGTPDLPGSYVDPTVIVGAEQSSEIVQEEIFGPVVTVLTHNGHEDAVAKANDIAYGLAASVWTRDIDRALDAAQRIQAGTVWINDHGPTAAEMPFGGYKQSGVGRDLSVHAVEDHMQLKHVAVTLRSPR